jgi:hypothetical protein
VRVICFTNVLLSALKCIIFQVREGLPENFPPFYAPGKCCATPAMARCSSNSCFSFDVLSRAPARPQKAGIHLQLAQPPPGFLRYSQRYKPLKYSRLFLFTDPRLRQRCPVGCAPRSASCWAVVVVVCCDEGPPSSWAAA